MYKNILLLILALFLGFAFYAVLTQVSKSSKSKRVECQTKTITFEKIFTEKPILEAVKQLKLGNYEIISNIEYSKQMKSHLIEIFNKEKSDELLNEILKKYITTNTKNSNGVLIDYYVYENDKEDTNKKNAEAKSYAGYLLFEFKYNNEVVYKIQTDYKDVNATDINERMDCVISSFTSIH